MKKLKSKKIYLSILLIFVFIAMFSVVCLAVSDYDVNTVYPDKSLFDIQDKFDYWTIHPTGKYGVYSDFDGLITIGSKQDKTKWEKNTYYIKRRDDNTVEIHSLCLSKNGNIYDDARVSFIWCDYSYTFNDKEEVKRQEDNWKTPLKDNTAFGFYSFAPDTSVVSGTAPIYLSYESAYDYLVNNNQNLSDTFYLTDDLKCEKPQNLSLYTDDNNNKMINIVWKQTDSIKSSYRSQITVAYQYKDDDDYSDMKGFIIDQDYNTVKDNVVRFDLSEIITNSGLDISGGYTQINLAFGVFNYDVSNSLGKSDTEVVAVLINKNGIFYQLTDNDGNIVQGQPIKNSTQFKNDNGYSFDDFTTIDSVSNNGFINSILSGFGLIGNNGLISFLVNVFAYVPSWLWSLIGTGIAFMIIIALFKLVVH